MRNSTGDRSIVKGGMTTRDRRIVCVLATLPSLLAASLGAILVASWRTALPDPVATHWSSHGADGFSDVTFVIVAPIVAGVIGAVAGIAVCVRSADPGIARVAVGTIAGVVISTVCVIVSTTACQRGVTEAASVPTPQWQIVVSMAAGLVCGLGVAALVPSWTTAPPAADVGDRPHVAVGAQERIVWTRVVTSSPVVSLLVGGTVVIVAGLALVLRSWPVAVVVVIVVVSAIAMWSVRVTVDRLGITVRGRLGWPRTHIAISEIDHAEVVGVRALRDFGGYGYRLAIHGDLKGAKGFVFRSGPALLVVRRNGRRDIVVVDDAATAAGVLNRLLDLEGPAERRPKVSGQ
ncbi:hypothetical protein GTV32_01200 [Gordonia sp. SID5947]|uniref:hypothetical protein n=1 Tax=Gordonia sp. SID5947 TaxID=2690315 RepID=UPI00136AD4D1|nr:hypothetical protein [Gordonia sp. SID5947]MYR05037.1 hypothetical protein [Gordonia sp. SID5947]